jgi:hypothetical protein
MPTPKSKLSKFILTLPSTLTGSQVIERAKAKGMKTSRANVSRVRGLFGAKAVKKSPTKPSATSKPATPTLKPNPPSKSDFIRQQPASLSPAEVVAKGKEKGITFSDSLVYMVRGPAKKKRSKAVAPTTKPAASPPSKPTPPSKSAFIRAIPFSVSAKDVVAQGKAAGLKLDTDYVYKVRGPKGARAKNGASKPTTAKPTAAAVTSGTSTRVASKTPAKPPKSKADFVRAYPDLSVKDLVGKALFDGIDLTENYVYRVRGMDKATRKTKRAAAKATTSTATAVNGTGASVASAAKPLSSAEDLLRAVAAELGLGRAVEILAGQRARVRAVIGG